MDKEMHAVSAACCGERPLSSSHFRVFWAAAKWLSVLSPRSCWSVQWTSSGPWETRLLSSMLFTTSLLSEVCAALRRCHRSTQSTVSVPEAHYTLREKNAFGLLIIYGLTSGVHTGSKSKTSTDVICLRLRYSRLWGVLRLSMLRQMHSTHSLTHTVHRRKE